MTPEMAVDLFRDALFIIVQMVAIIVVPSLIVGLMVSVFQAATQINEQTLSFLPRLLVTLITIMLAGPWLLAKLMDFFNNLMAAIPLMIG
ncbi:flagellar biosynthesis protein FliQ [Aestuariirhabdus litorea]|uniref:Flagellar biosynthetic protein FliQ n=1 Tax=Aestuariirhabdus litorea TaxID=2528527 RepID=A0A3P3VTI8_9GAMM|nr:flagellar biosynthesis protein FliQ [Aestuariirhabdus litorea]RRJ84986.1 flagellar biosynthetic protein FliQ [Aestuariirhabdus litorea]RWW98211.1 flagellar biosynthesis protein FliQ [Endozoicomonadaceae bacterium GTF-13]